MDGSNPNEPEGEKPKLNLKDEQAVEFSHAQVTDIGQRVLVDATFRAKLGAVTGAKITNFNYKELCAVAKQYNAAQFAESKKHLHGAFEIVFALQQEEAKWRTADPNGTATPIFDLCRRYSQTLLKAYTALYQGSFLQWEFCEALYTALNAGYKGGFDNQMRKEYEQKFAQVYADTMSLKAELGMATPEAVERAEENMREVEKRLEFLTLSAADREKVGKETAFLGDVKSETKRRGRLLTSSEVNELKGWGKETALALRSALEKKGKLNPIKPADQMATYWQPEGMDEYGWQGT